MELSGKQHYSEYKKCNYFYVLLESFLRQIVEQGKAACVGVFITTLMAHRLESTGTSSYPHLSMIPAHASTKALKGIGGKISSIIYKL